MRLPLAALTFDVSVLEETLVLYHGLTGILATEEEIHNPLLLADLILKNHVDIMMCTPSLMNSLLDLPELKEALCRLKAVEIGAEAFPASMYRKMRQIGITAEIYNGYDPTETTIACTIAHLKGDRITIGGPMSNTKLCILGQFGHILLPSVPGELTILGACVGRGYVGNETLTREKFITVDGLPAYRSGDLTKWNRAGCMDFIGRMDNQVKLRGLLLAGADSRFTVFHPRNSHTVQMGDLIAAMNEQGIPISPVDDALFTAAILIVCFAGTTGQPTGPHGSINERSDTNG